jgi:hypothetical protein
MKRPHSEAPAHAQWRRAASSRRLTRPDVTTIAPPTLSLRHGQPPGRVIVSDMTAAGSSGAATPAGRLDVAGLTGKGQAASEGDRTAGRWQRGTDGPATGTSVERVPSMRARFGR